MLDSMATSDMQQYHLTGELALASLLEALERADVDRHQLYDVLNSS